MSTSKIGKKEVENLVCFSHGESLSRPAECNVMLGGVKEKEVTSIGKSRMKQA